MNQRKTTDNRTAEPAAKSKKRIRRLEPGKFSMDVSDLPIGYSVHRTGDVYLIVANVPARQLNHVFTTVCTLIEEYAYFVLEHENREQETNTRDVYFWTGMLQDDFWRVYARYQQLLMTSRSLAFGYAAHSGEDEVYLTEDKIIRIFTRDPDKFSVLLQMLQLSQRPYLITAPEVVEWERPEGNSEEQRQILYMLDDLVQSDLRFAKRYILAENEQNA